MTAGIRVVKPVDVVDAPDLTITEYVGRVASADSACSACVATVRSATKELPQCPSFDEFVLVLEGEVHIMHGANLTECAIVRAGEGLVLRKHTRVQWVWPGPCKYVPICLPAFSPSNCGREETFGGPAAKTEASMDRLRELHAAMARSRLESATSTWFGGVALGLLLGVATAAHCVEAGGPQMQSPYV
eukprot:CAMPEP_0185289702 /NCGR_PEP_ID=MMETSP1363-20130426/4046_1 /TAXON_ID=38817 /ORGANISM="Gephyrocapsa oceanica, Strain RCC1303" /LENGTH=187 /DNA_ID=CAMNT_0027885599 /DNA_START=87 /DNA_END=651 /DNA_ORIENTATION=+